MKNWISALVSTSIILFAADASANPFKYGSCNRWDWAEDYWEPMTYFANVTLQKKNGSTWDDVDSSYGETLAPIGWFSFGNHWNNGGHGAGTYRVKLVLDWYVLGLGPGAELRCPGRLCVRAGRRLLR